MLNSDDLTEDVAESAQHAQVKRTSLILMVMTLLSRILGIVRIRVVSTFFGASGIADVINFTFNIPNNLRKLLAEGALSSAFIPVFSRTRAKAGRASSSGSHESSRSSYLISLIITFQLIILIPLVLITACFSHQIVMFLADFSDASLIEASSTLLVWFSIYLVLVSISAILQAVLHCEGDFFITAVAPLVFSISVISSIYLFATRYSSLSMAYGVVFGGLFQVLILIPIFHLRGYRIHFSCKFRDAAFREVLKAWGPVMVTSLLPVITQQFAYYLASRLEGGSVTALSNSLIFLQMPYGVFFVSIMTVYFPCLSMAFASNRSDLLQTRIICGVRYIGVFLIPSSIILIGFSEELVAVLLQKGLFTLADSLTTASVLRLYCMGMLFMGLFGFLQRYLYASHQFRLSLLVISIVSLVDVILSLWGLSWWKSVEVIALANTISLMLGTLIIILILSRDLRSRWKYQIVTYYGRIIIANLPLSLAILLYRSNQPTWWTSGSTFQNFFVLIGICSVVLALTIGMYMTLRIDFLGVLKRKRSSDQNAG